MAKITVKDADKEVERLARVARATGKPEGIRLAVRAERAATRFWNARDKMLRGEENEGYVRRLQRIKDETLEKLDNWCSEQPRYWPVEFRLLEKPRKKRTGVTLGINQADALSNFLVDFSPSFGTIVAIRVVPDDKPFSLGLKK